MNMVTINDVAKRSGVSATTVSHALNETRHVSAEAKRRVLETVKELNYQPNSVARSLRKKESQSFGLILPDSANQYFAEIQVGVEKAAYEKGYSVILCNTEGDLEKEKLYVKVLRNKQVDGILFISVGNQTETLKSLQESKIPIVLVDRDLPDLDIDSVIADNYQGGYLATKHLILLGHKRIGCITGPTGILASGRRIAGYKKALEESGIAFDMELIKSGDFHAASGKTAALQLLNQPQRPSAIFAFNDLMAMGAIQAAIACNRSIPRDISVIGFDDIELSSYLQPPLTTIRQPKQEMGRMAVEMLLNRIENHDLPAIKVVLPISIINRESCGVMN
jgi:LacI family transcriptional regulator